jgi:predicted GNAT superfamily acetyltransferase
MTQADLFETKLRQRKRALDEGLDLIGWSFDPLDADAARVFIGQLGAVVERYLPAEDRLVAEWWIREPHVERRLSALGRLTLRAREAADAPVIRKDQAPVIGDQRGGGSKPVPRRVWVEIPLRSDESWREHIREVFTTYMVRRYRIVDFVADNPNSIGRYLLALKE